MNVAQWLFASACLRPTAPALFIGTEQIANYGQFADQACALAGHLKTKYAIQPGDRVALYMPNRVEYLVLMYATWWIGAVIVPINYKLHTREAAWIANNAEASIVFTDSGATFAVNELPAGCIEVGIDTDSFHNLLSGPGVTTSPDVLAPHTLAWLFYTSGTTGRPKGVMLSHNNLMAMTLCYPIDVDQVSADDAVIYAAPLSHGAGLYNLIFVRMGARHVVPASRGFNSTEILDLAHTLRNATMFAAPTMVKRLMADAKAKHVDGDGIKSIILGGGPMYAADLIDALDIFGPKLMQIYGQGESPMTITAVQRDVISQRDHPEWENRLASVGVAQSCVQLRVVDGDFNDVPMGECGEVIVRGPVVMQGYWRNEQATRETLVDGWLRTGDIGHLSRAGFLTLTDRSKDVIISGGSNIYPREVEEVLARHPDVFEVAVVGAPHPEWGEEVVAFVVSNYGAKISTIELDEWCKLHIASFKKPKKYEFCSDLPKNSYGKILKSRLRENANAL